MPTNYSHVKIEPTRLNDRWCQETEWTQEIMNTIPDLLFELDKEGNYLNVWTQNEELLVLQKELLLHKNIRDVLSPQAVEIAFHTMREVDINGSSRGHVMCVELPAGQQYFELSASKKRSTGSYIILSRDITERKQMESELTKQKKFLNTLLLSIAEAGIGVHVIENERYIYTNDIPKAKNYGYNEHIFDLKPCFLDTIHPDEKAKVWDTHRRRLRGEKVPTNYEVKVVEHDGSVKEHSVSVVLVPHSDPVQTIVVTQDITEQKLLQEKISKNEKRLKEAQKVAKIGSWELEFPGLRFHWSDEVYRIFEIPQGDWEPSYDHFLNLVHPDERAYIDLQYHSAIKKRTPYNVTYRILLHDEKIKYIHEKGRITYDEHDHPLRAIGTIQDITKSEMAKKQIEHMAHHDFLTGLPNRVLSKKRAEQIIANAQKTESKVAFLFIDLDGFKTINDTLGHSAGDIMLKTLASRLKDSIMESDIISRQGGDEFLIILSHMRSEEEIALFAQKLLNMSEQSFEISAQTLSTSASIGIAVYPDHGTKFESLLKNADTAMYKAKEQGKNTYCFYSQQMNHHLIGQFKLQNDLKAALRNEEFILFYQPQIDLKSKKIVGAEALIRWRHPQLGMIPPMRFISIAENTGLIVPMGEWVVREACAQAAKWRDMGIHICIAVNISSVQFKRGNLEEIVKSAIADAHLNPQYLELELTESIMMHDTDNTLQTVRNLKTHGVQLSIDDFGTGYSSLAYLKRFAVDKLKIDQSFIRDILQDQEDSVIVNTIIQMAKSLNLKTIAEGVENADVLRILQEFDCDEVQGYHFAKPMEMSEFEDFFFTYSQTDERNKACFQPSQADVKPQ